jgi:hypothetical protein
LGIIKRRKEGIYVPGGENEKKEGLFNFLCFFIASFYEENYFSWDFLHLI